MGGVRPLDSKMSDKSPKMVKYRPNRAVFLFFFRKNNVKPIAKVLSFQFFAVFRWFLEVPIRSEYFLLN